MAVLSSNLKCLIFRGTEQQALDYPDNIRLKGCGFALDTNTLFFFYDGKFCKIIGVDIGERLTSIDVGQIGHLKNDESITIAGETRLFNFKGYMNVFVSITPIITFKPFEKTKYDIIPIKTIVDDKFIPPKRERWWHP